MFYGFCPLDGDTFVGITVFRSVACLFYHIVMKALQGWKIMHPCACIFEKFRLYKPSCLCTKASSYTEVYWESSKVDLINWLQRPAVFINRSLQNTDLKSSALAASLFSAHLHFNTWNPGNRYPVMHVKTTHGLQTPQFNGLFSCSCLHIVAEGTLLSLNTILKISFSLIVKTNTDMYLIKDFHRM